MMPRRAARLVWPLAVGLLAGGGLSLTLGDSEPAGVKIPAFPRDTNAYRGPGAWVDAFDYSPAYQENGAEPPLDPSAVDDMAAAGVRTLFIQAARDDERSPKGIVDEELLSEFVLRAHVQGMRVIGWYLPTFTDVDKDLELLLAIDGFDADGARFDGLAVDIEFTEGVTDVGDRNRRLVTLSRRLRAATDGDALGAIVLPPVLIEVVNPDFWPELPWRKLSEFYDVWLPMSYWTERAPDSGFQDGLTYNAENTRRLRTRLGDPEARVHGIGGIGDEVTPESLARFADSLTETGSIGGSIYDWATLTPEHRILMSDLSGADV